MHISVFDSRFSRLLPLSAPVQILYQGTRWSDGPVWFDEGCYLLWSDIPTNRILCWSEGTGRVGTFRGQSGHASGNTRDHERRLVTCEHQARRITRTERDGSITILADSYRGKRFNSPRDLIVRSDGSIWFSDPDFSINVSEGNSIQAELPECVYRIDGKSGVVMLVAADVLGPNGLAFSPDETLLYVAGSRGTRQNIRRYEIAADGRSLANGHVFIDAKDGQPDGIRVDIHGNLWCAWGGERADLNGVRVFSSQGEPLGHIALPERCSNLCFGGQRRDRLFITTVRGLHAVSVNTQGMRDC